MTFARWVAFLSCCVALACTTGCSAILGDFSDGTSADDGGVSADTGPPSTSDDATTGTVDAIPPPTSDDATVPVDSSPSSGDDAGEDSATRFDAGSDAGLDSGSDAAHDAGVDAADAGCRLADGGVCTATLTVTSAGTGTGTVTSAPAGISCGSTCVSAFPLATSVTLTAAAATGSTFAGWSGGACTGTGSCIVDVDVATTVTATFTLENLTLTVKPAGTGTGTITSSPAGINCGATCTFNYTYDTAITLTAKPATGATFTGWSGACTGTGTCAVTMTAAESVTATFGVATEALTVGASAYGTVTSSPAGISCGATCSASFNYGTPVTLTATPIAGWGFTGWSGGGCTGAGACVVDVTAATTVTPTYAATSTVWDPTWSVAGGAFTNGNLSIAQTSASTVEFRTNIGKSSGLWYWEITATAGVATTDAGGLGIADSNWPNTASWVGSAANSLGFGYAGAYWYTTWTGATISTVEPPANSSVAAGTVYMFALNMNTGSLWVGVDGTWFNSGSPAAGTNPVVTGLTGTVYPAVTLYGSSADAFTANFGASRFAYTVPSGFVPGILPSVYGYPNIVCSGSGNVSPNYLLGEAITISTPVTVTGLAVTMSSALAGDAMAALYDNSGTGGAPGKLLVETSSIVDLAAGVTVIPVPATSVAAGTYWMMANYSVLANFCTDTSETNPEDYVSLAYGNALPNPFGTASTATYYHFGYYVVGH